MCLQHVEGSGIGGKIETTNTLGADIDYSKKDLVNKVSD